MTITKHCKTRQNQRHISDLMIHVALQYGRNKRHTDKVVLEKNEVEELCDNLCSLLKQLEN